MPVCTTELVSDCASAEGADGTEVSKKCSFFCTLLRKDEYDYCHVDDANRTAERFIDHLGVIGGVDTA